MDVSMPGLNGLQATRIIHDSLPETKVLLLTLHSFGEFVRSAFHAWARGYVLKSDAENELVRALNVVVGEGQVCQSRDRRAPPGKRYLPCP
jgi:DNA-binding NarL/FixJ family response regulator